jgi:hypothetical protein
MYLTSKAGAYCNGLVLLVDGGYVISSMYSDKFHRGCVG